MALGLRGLIRQVNWLGVSKYRTFTSRTGTVSWLESLVLTPCRHNISFFPAAWEMLWIVTCVVKYALLTGPPWAEGGPRYVVSAWYSMSVGGLAASSTFLNFICAVTEGGRPKSNSTNRRRTATRKESGDGTFILPVVTVAEDGTKLRKTAWTGCVFRSATIPTAMNWPNSFFMRASSTEGGTA